MNEEMTGNTSDFTLHTHTHRKETETMCNKDSLSYIGAILGGTIGRKNLGGGRQELVNQIHVADHVLLAASGGKVGLDCTENRLELVKSDSLLTESCSATDFEDLGVGHIASQRTQNVAHVESVDVISFVSFVENDEGVFRVCFGHFGDLMDFFQIRKTRKT